VEKVFNFSHKRSGLAGVEIYETRWTTNDKSFEIQEWGGGGVLGGKSRVNKRRSVSKTFEGCGERGEMWKKITDEDIREALFNQSVQKAPGPDRLGFKAIRLLWDSQTIINVVKRSFRLGLHPRVWKEAKGVVIPKPNKPDYGVAKAYRVITLLNCPGKVVEKVAANAIAEECISNDPNFCLKHPGVPDGSDGSDGTSYALTENYTLCVAQATGRVAYVPSLLCGDVYASSERHVCYTLHRGCSYAEADFQKSIRP